ncbi:MAG: hypothetical protein U9P73_05225 [Candidatus Cloacimonadota bacterium]|nr:hypothetical protein [Candidatus Cloacimonadota bacterium]
MKKYFMFAVVVLLIIGCNSKESGTKQELIESLKSEEKTDSVAVTDLEPIAEKTTEQAPEQTEKISEKEVLEDEANLWSSYRSAKDAVKEAEANNDYTKQAQHLLEAAEFANALHRYDIEAWQYNNAGYALIEDFKEKTEYMSVMDALNKLELKSEIMEYRKETRSFMSIEKELLTKAAKHLAQAKEIDDKLESSSRTTIIANNILFVDDVLSFLDVGEKE